MPLLAANELAVMFWAGRDPHETLRELVSLGVRCGQLGIPGDYDLTGAAQAWKAAAAELEFRIYTVFAAYRGESYAGVAAVRDTVGFVPPATRAEREARTLDVSRFAYEIGTFSIATHVGCIPPDPADPAHAAVLETVRRVCDLAAQFDQNFALETGQEPAAGLLHFLHSAGRGNLGINFDPANMILYGTGDPVEAVKVLRHHLLSVHCKDGKWPTAPGALGTEVPLGQGDVKWPQFLKALEEAGYSGPLSVERETDDPERRIADIRAGLSMLKELKLCDCERV
jgi:sugar phosphate isomerase/epimerase